MTDTINHTVFVVLTSI